jgi:hypothetical protein
MEPALIVAIIGLLLAVASLIWQAYTFSRSGIRVMLKVGTGFAAYENPRQVGPPLLTTTAINVGRFGTSVTSWGIRFPGGLSLARMPNEDPPWAAPPPGARLEGGEALEFYWPLYELAASIRSDPRLDPNQARVFVNLAIGKTVLSKRLTHLESYIRGPQP